MQSLYSCHIVSPLWAYCIKTGAASDRGWLLTWPGHFVCLVVEYLFRNGCSLVNINKWCKKIFILCAHSYGSTHNPFPDFLFPNLPIFILTVFAIAHKSVIIFTSGHFSCPKQMPCALIQGSAHWEDSILWLPLKVTSKWSIFGLYLPSKQTHLWIKFSIFSHQLDTKKSHAATGVRWRRGISAALVDDIGV